MYLHFYHFLYLLLLFPVHPDRKSTRLNSSHLGISYAVFCLQKIFHAFGLTGGMLTPLLSRVRTALRPQRRRLQRPAALPRLRTHRGDADAAPFFFADGPFPDAPPLRPHPGFHL